MATTLQLDQEAVALLDKYCNRSDRTATVSTMVDRIAKQWITQGFSAWKQNPVMLMNFKIKAEKINENKIMGVKIRSVTANNFKRGCEILNVDPVVLLSWLSKVFIKAFNIKEMAKYKPKGTIGSRKT